MLRIVISFVVAFAAAALGGKGLIPLLRRMKAGQSIKEIGPTWHMSKQGTPTMGGLMFIIGSAAAVLLLGWPDFAAGRFGGGFVLLFALVFGVIGYIDDYVKVKKHQNTGLTAPQKFLLVVDLRGDIHHGQASRGKEGLAEEVEGGAFVLLQVRRGVGGGKHHDHADAGEQEHQHQEGQVHGSPGQLLLNGQVALAFCQGAPLLSPNSGWITGP